MLKDSLCLLGNFTYFLLSAVFLLMFFSKSTILKIPSVSNNLDPDQARQFVKPNLGPNCLQKLSADDTSRQKVKTCAN